MAGCNARLREFLANTGMRLRARHVSLDLGEVLAINQASRPAVGDLSLSDLAQLVGWCAHARVAVGAGGVVGYLMALEPGQPYGSPNYRYFESKLDDHVYVDRIAVAPGERPPQPSDERRARAGVNSQFRSRPR